MTTEVRCSFCRKELNGAEKMDADCRSCPNVTCYSIVCEQRHCHVCSESKGAE
jgi:hypothetical protein